MACQKSSSADSIFSKISTTFSPSVLDFLCPFAFLFTYRRNASAAFSSSKSSSTPGAGFPNACCRAFTSSSENMSIARNIPIAEWKNSWKSLPASEVSAMFTCPVRTATPSPVIVQSGIGVEKSFTPLRSWLPTNAPMRAARSSPVRAASFSGVIEFPCTSSRQRSGAQAQKDAAISGSFVLNWRETPFGLPTWTSMTPSTPAPALKRAAPRPRNLWRILKVSPPSYSTSHHAPRVARTAAQIDSTPGSFTPSGMAFSAFRVRWESSVRAVFASSSVGTSCAESAVQRLAHSWRSRNIMPRPMTSTMCSPSGLLRTSGYMAPITASTARIPSPVPESPRSSRASGSTDAIADTAFLRLSSVISSGTPAYALFALESPAACPARLRRRRSLASASAPFLSSASIAPKRRSVAKALTIPRLDEQTMSRSEYPVSVLPTSRSPRPYAASCADRRSKAPGIILRSDALPSFSRPSTRCTNVEYVGMNCMNIICGVISTAFPFAASIDSMIARARCTTASAFADASAAPEPFFLLAIFSVSYRSTSSRSSFSNALRFSTESPNPVAPVLPVAALRVAPSIAPLQMSPTNLWTQRSDSASLLRNPARIVWSSAPPNA